MRIYLIGMPGCGKSTVGMKLANKLGYEYIDLDSLIEKNAGMFISDIFDRYGEETFRNLETENLMDLKMDNVVISTGGGIIKNKENKKHMDGIIIYIKVDLDELANRIKNDDENIRPLMRVKSAYELYDERKDLYDYFKDIEVENIDVDVCVNDIMEALK